MILEVKDLSVRYCHGRREICALDKVTFTVEEGEILGIVGESGSGKSTLALSILNLLPPDSKKGGGVFFKANDVFSFPPQKLRLFRGNDVGLVFQDPPSSFNPVLSIGYQFEEILKEKLGVRSREQRLKIIVNSFRKVRLFDTQRIIRSYPHQLSGGQLQRVAIAMAISLNPSILVTDEPTSALDVTIESQILYLFKELREKFNLTVIFITHNLDLVKVLCDRVLVLFKGEVREIKEKDELFTSPEDKYTRDLLRAFRELED
jgi:ABC-type dipeptide/oligopeptide/nickel transport system ATPase component